MAQEITLGQLRNWLILYADRIIAEEEQLTRLDTAIGDADHGVNMRRGMEKVRERLLDPENHYADVGTLFRSVAMTLISAVGGAAGPLYGTFFLRAATSPNSGSRVDLSQFTRMLRFGLDGLQQRGKAYVDDKTMVDAIQPAVEAMEAALASQQSWAVALAAAKQAARLGMEHTIEIRANKGRASYLGDRSIGHQDPGATSAYLLFETAVAALSTSAPLKVNGQEPAAASPRSVPTQAGKQKNTD
ncbi:MAG: dihydroxyacetone kinase subunit L [Chloroflexi bacterium]|nr:dihydroxyacetone kinase subunit L [Chloroflexota bacterium]